MITTFETAAVEHQRLIVDSYDTSAVSLELWDCILDFVDDFPTWKTCAITCRAFLRRCRYHLYRKVYLKNYHDAKVLVRALRKDHASRSAIRELQLDFPASTRPTGPVGKYLLAMLSNLQHLHIRSNKYRDPIHPEFYTTLRAVAETVTSLTLDWCTFHDAVDLARLMATLPNTRDLVVTEVTVYGPCGELSRALDPDQWNAIRVSTLRFTEFLWPCMEHLTRMFSKSATTQTMQKVYCQPHHMAPSTDLQNFLHVFGHSMHTLAVAVPLPWKGDPPSLHGASALRYLHLGSATNTMHVCTGILRSLPPRALVGLSLAVGSYERRAFEAPETTPWERMAALADLNSLLSHDQFTSLRRLSVRCSMGQPRWHCFLSSQECREAVMSRFLTSLNPRMWDERLDHVFDFAPEIWKYWK